MNDLQSDAEALRGLSVLKPTSARLALVEKALASKWEGTQSIAVQTLGAWGGRQAVVLLRPFLEQAFVRDAGWSIRGVVIRALVDNIGPEDASWVRALYDSRSSGLERHELRPLMERITADR